MKYLDKARIQVILGYIVAATIGAFLLKDAYRLILFSNRGLDFTDEAFYALSYSTKSEVGRSFTGATWLVGAFYDILGQDLARLRVLKVFSLLFAGGLLGWQTFEWIFSHKKENFSSTYKQLRGWKWALILGSSLCALAPYTWTPATPSYNDLNLIILLLIAATCISLLRKREVTSLRWPLLLRFVALGMLLGAESFVKWSSAITAFILVIPVIAYYFDSLVALAKVCAALVVGYIMFWILTFILIVNIFEVVPRSLELLQIITKDGYDPSTLVQGYIAQFKMEIKLIVTDQKLLFVLCLVLPSVFRKFPKYIGAAASMLLVVPIIRALTSYTYIQGGPSATVYRGRLFVIALLAYCIALGLGHLISHLIFARPDKATAITRSRNFASSIIHVPTFLRAHPLLPVLWLLFLIPLVQATGTLNDIFTGATFSNVTWLLACVVIATWFSMTTFVRFAIILLALFGVWGMHHKIIDGFINKPYRLIHSPARQHTAVKGLPAIKELRFDEPTATYLSQLSDIFNKAGIEDGATMIGIWNVPGEIYALGGVSPGEPWYIGGYDTRNIANINYSCKTGQIDKKEPPVILKTLEPSEEFLSALSDCGIDFPKDYKKVGSAKSPFTLLITQVYVPR